MQQQGCAVFASRARQISRRVVCCALLVLAAFAALPVAAQTTGSAASPEPSSTRERKVALVVGNSAYESSPLKNPVNDARAVAKMLRELGFDVLLRENLSEAAFVEALRVFGNRLRPGSVSLFYFAGHGMQVKGRNYLIPVGASIESEDDVPYRAVDANRVLDKMAYANSSLNLVILDACRNNPFTRSFRAQINGLAHMEAPSGTLIAFATSPGSVAADGEGANSTYTKYLLANIATPGVPVEIALKRVREGVSRETLGKQIPWESSSMMGDFYFRPGDAGAQVALIETADTKLATEKAFWDSIQGKGGAEEYLAYLRQFPNGRFAALAKTRLRAAQANAPVVEPAAASDTFELSYWDSVKNSGNAADFRSYLEQYPKGRFASLARNRIAAMTPQVAAARATTPEIAGALRDLPSVGDTWTYNVIDRGRKTDTLIASIAGVSSDGRVTEKVTRGKYPAFSAKRTFDPEFDPRAYQELETPGQMFLAEFSPYTSPDPSLIGKVWEELTPALTSGVAGEPVRRQLWTMHLEVVGAEKIRVPAGEFMTIKVEGVTQSATSGWKTNIRLVYWYAPQVKRTIRFTRVVRTEHTVSQQEEIYELASYKLKE